MRCRPSGTLRANVTEPGARTNPPRSASTASSRRSATSRIHAVTADLSVIPAHPLRVAVESLGLDAEQRAIGLDDRTVANAQLAVRAYATNSSSSVRYQVKRNDRNLTSTAQGTIINRDTRTPLVPSSGSTPVPTRALCLA